MERSEWMEQIRKRTEVYFAYAAEEHMDRDTFEWNLAFMDKYHELTNWTSEDGTKVHSREKIANDLGLPREIAWEFVTGVRRQIAAYRTERLKALLEAGEEVRDIAHDLCITEGSVCRMIERLGL